MRLPNFQCPNCARTDDLIVFVSVERLLVQSEDGNVETTEPSHGNHEEWDCESTMRCGSCGYRGEVAEFDLSLQEGADAAPPGDR